MFGYAEHGLLGLPIEALLPERLRAGHGAHRNRFMAKAEKQRVDAFMAREKPKLAATVLEPFDQDMRTLRDKGYTIRQIVAFLREQGIETSVTTVRNFLKE